MKYSIPYTPGLYDIIQRMTDENKLKINDVYFSDNQLSSNRKFSFDTDYWIELKRIKNDFNIKLHYVINSSVYDNASYFQEGQHKLISILWNIYNDGCTYLTYNNSFMLRIPEFRQKIPPFKIKPSINNKIMTLENVEFYYTNMNIKDFILDRSLNRNYDELKRIYEWTKDKDISLSLLANEGCIPNCIWKQHCDNLISQFSKNTEDDQKHLVKIHTDTLCGRHYTEQPADYLKSPWIPPNAIQYYEDIIDVIKIGGRMIAPNVLERMLDVYFNNRHDDFVYGLILTSSPQEYKQIYLAELEDNNYSGKTLNCKNKCSECNFCDLVFNKLMKGE